MKSYETVAKIYEITQQEWKIDGEYKVPDEDRIILMLVNLEQLLRTAQGDLSQVESGGIILRRDGKHVDVFVHAGELDLDDDGTT